MLLSGNNKGMNGVYLIFSLGLLLVVFLLVISYAIEISGLMGEKQEKTFSLLTAHRIDRAFDLYKRNGVVTTIFLDTGFLVYGIRPLALDILASNGMIQVNSSFPLGIPASESFDLWKKGGLYVLEVGA